MYFYADPAPKQACFIDIVLSAGRKECISTLILLQNKLALQNCFEGRA